MLSDWELDMLIKDLFYERFWLMDYLFSYKLDENYDEGVWLLLLD